MGLGRPVYICSLDCVPYLFGAAFAEGKVADYKYGYESNQSPTKSHEVSSSERQLGVRSAWVMSQIKRPSKCMS